MGKNIISTLFLTSILCCNLVMAAQAPVDSIDNESFFEENYLDNHDDMEIRYEVELTPRAETST